MEGIKAHCRRVWGVEPRAHHIPITYGGLDLTQTSNIVLSNGAGAHAGLGRRLSPGALHSAQAGKGKGSEYE